MPPLAKKLRGGLAKISTQDTVLVKSRVGLHALVSEVLTTRSQFRLATEIYIDHKPAGYAFAGDHPQLTEAETLAKFAPPA